MEHVSQVFHIVKTDNSLIVRLLRKQRNSEQQSDNQ